LDRTVYDPRPDRLDKQPPLGLEPRRPLQVIPDDRYRRIGGHIPRFHRAVPWTPWLSLDCHAADEQEPDVLAAANHPDPIRVRLWPLSLAIHVECGPLAERVLFAL